MGTDCIGIFALAVVLVWLVIAAARILLGGETSVENIHEADTKPEAGDS